MFIKILCGECGGEYEHSAPFTYSCVLCGHSITTFDLSLDEGEAVGEFLGRLGYWTEGG